MQTTLPAIQKTCKRARRIVLYSARNARWDKRHYNREHRRYLNALTRGFLRDPERFYDEPFHAPSLSMWDIC